MRQFKFFGTPIAALTLLGFVGSQPALAAYPLSSDFSINQPQASRAIDGSFQLAVMGNSGVPLDIPTEKFPPKAQSEKPAVVKPKAAPKKATKPKKRKIKTAQTKKAPAKKPVVAEKEEGFLTKTFNTLIGSDEDKKNPASKSLVQKSSGKNPKPAKKEEGLLTKTLNTLVGGDDGKKEEPAPKSQPQKTASKKPEPEKKEEGLLTKTLKSLVGGDEDKKEEKVVKKKSLNPINMVPTGSVSHQKKKEEEPKTAKSETKKTLKDSFEKLIGVGAVDKEAIEKKPKVTKKAEVKKVVEKKAPRPKRITARKYIEQEEAQLEKDRGGAKKGKNVLKDSFQKLLDDDKDKKQALTE